LHAPIRMIPKIIHQTWKTDQIPCEWKAFAQSWRHHHPDWEYRLWSNTDGADFVEQFYPEFKETYIAYPYDIQRADAIRYLVIYHYGGIYADLDFECLQSFEVWRNNTQVIIGFEPEQHAHEHLKEEFLCNALFAAPSGSEFLRRVIDFLVTDETKALTHNDVVRTTGPLMLQEVYEKHEKQGVHAQPPIRFYPFARNSADLALLSENSVASERIRQKLVSRGCFAVHHWANSWVSDLAGTLINPEPDSIDGFVFYPMHDSPGRDLFNGGRDILRLAERCLSDPRVVAFNTDGFAKHTVLATTELIRLQGENQNEGIYVKKSNTEAAILAKHILRWLINIAGVGPKLLKLCFSKMAWRQ
jgi:hypothetical protein